MSDDAIIQTGSPAPSTGRALMLLALALGLIALPFLVQALGQPALHLPPPGRGYADPAMIAAVQDVDGSVVGIQRTFLDNEGRKSERYVSQTDNLAYAHSVERSSLDLEEGLLRDCARLSKQFVSCRYSVTTE